jgi:hypothetical protein
MLDETNLTAALDALGYKRIKRRKYSFAKFEPDVEHFLYFQSWGIGQFFVSADFGFGNRAARDFAMAMLMKYGHPIFTEFRDKMERSDTLMRFPVHRFTSMTDRPWQNDKSDPSDMSGHIVTFVTTHHLPFVQGLGDLSALLARLVADGEPCPWFATNAAARSAAIVFLAKRTGQSPEFAHKAITPRENLMTRELAPSLRAHDYVEALFKETGFS